WFCAPFFGIVLALQCFNLVILLRRLTLLPAMAVICGSQHLADSSSKRLIERRKPVYVIICCLLFDVNPQK
ncbi:MAG: hypothetical protein LUG17_03295, partial [Clostridiales bacterium]|nr:hypothetical protein [Clostridiales bacterium]